MDAESDIEKQQWNILYVMQLLVIKHKNTLIYVELAKFEKDEEFICKVAKTPKEIRALIEAGFEYVLERNGLAYFRKRK